MALGDFIALNMLLLNYWQKINDMVNNNTQSIRSFKGFQHLQWKINCDTLTTKVPKTEEICYIVAENLKFVWCCSKALLILIVGSCRDTAGPPSSLHFFFQFSLFLNLWEVKGLAVLLELAIMWFSSFLFTYC